jgi:hypothetical protein
MNWEAMSEGEREAANEEAYGAAGDMLRRAKAEFPGCELDEYRRTVAARLDADSAENARLIKRGQRSRATKLDRKSAEWAKASEARLALVQGFVWDWEP